MHQYEIRRQLISPRCALSFDVGVVSRWSVPSGLENGELECIWPMIALAWFDCCTPTGGLALPSSTPADSGPGLGLLAEAHTLSIHLPAALNSHSLKRKKEDTKVVSGFTIKWSPEQIDTGTERIQKSILESAGATSEAQLKSFRDMGLKPMEEG
ncbi:hypothetical protein J0S82_012307 [Galemys pyrenaicus]|uniref:Uncharacterized protein n=1 Tax=Galemys pyrenaicus TaxID=202257 RepID=A0A8J6DJV2_GALPY|nr:hypothetical protein J0S82_012307 [Galemys pyrenaicus]